MQYLNLWVFVDLFTLAIGVYGAVVVVRSGLRGRLGRMGFAMAGGILVLGASHIIDTMLSETGPFKGALDALPPPLEHRLFNLVGFLLLIFSLLRVISLAGPAPVRARIDEPAK